ncbi:hypothetical protein VTO73DRAFT_2422 [Trametes versicolor]
MMPETVPSFLHLLLLPKNYAVPPVLSDTFTGILSHLTSQRPSSATALPHGGTAQRCSHCPVVPAPLHPGLGDHPPHPSPTYIRIHAQRSRSACSMPPSTTLLTPGLGSGEACLDAHVAIASMALVPLRLNSDSQCLHSQPANYLLSAESRMQCDRSPNALRLPADPSTNDYAQAAVPSESIVSASLAMLVAGERVVVVFIRPRSPLAFLSADASHGVE